MQDRIVSYEGNKYGKRALHNLLLIFLEKFDAHCREYKIPYSLAYGSALGCIRNHGFIPWDNDVDVMMKRADYNRFFDSLKDKETLFARESNVEIPIILPKVCDLTSKEFPIHIDIYAIDNVPDNYVTSSFKLLIVQILKNIILGRCAIKDTLFCKVRRGLAYVISFPFSVEKIKKCLKAICAKDNNIVTHRIGSYYAGHKSIGKYHSSSMLDNLVYVRFEDIELPVVADHHSYLLKEFGSDYLTPKTKSGKIQND